MYGKLLISAIVASVATAATLGPASADTLRVGGTGALLGLVDRLCDQFKARHPGDTVEVIAGMGSSGGIAAVIEGALQLAVSGRDLNARERDKGARSSVLLDTPFMFVSSHPDRQKLTLADVVGIYNGLLTRWPDGKEIKPVLRPKSDSASAYLVDHIPAMREALDTLRKRPDVPVAATDQDNAAMAEKVANSLSAMTLVQYMTERPKLHMVELNGVEPSVATMRSGHYPLRISLYVVEGPQPSAVAQRFLAFLKTPEAEKIMADNGGVAPVNAKTAAQ
ncbi:MAG: substrate-binding domain-containing protein [Proteobacteria bacterium]|nr:substrate-binding domain-containing protein [Pseudomonadota bacterium]